MTFGIFSEAGTRNFSAKLQRKLLTRQHSPRTAVTHRTSGRLAASRRFLEYVSSCCSAPVPFVSNRPPPTSSVLYRVVPRAEGRSFDVPCDTDTDAAGSDHTHAAAAPSSGCQSSNSRGQQHGTSARPAPVIHIVLIRNVH
jgi:hypothetical protein